ncbi:hypothetical protein CHELA40_13607 [Chelatococcus asaccharovorans]|nr:hypothetical protein CHELA40_13607 [Chelatococcus asaccharovorans]CAH1676855.1 hypothetical protein CHELA17_62015 [Chelatococcus asaccharovorans]
MGISPRARRKTDRNLGVLPRRAQQQGPATRTAGSRLALHVTAGAVERSTHREESRPPQMLPWEHAMAGRLAAVKRGRAEACPFLYQRWTTTRVPTRTRE